MIILFQVVTESTFLIKCVMRERFTLCDLFTYAASSSSSIKSIPYTFSGSQTGVIEIGRGNLKLIYSGDDGKLTQYVNSKSSVCNLQNASYFYLYPLASILINFRSSLLRSNVVEVHDNMYITMFYNEGECFSRAIVQLLCWGRRES